MPVLPTKKTVKPFICQAYQRLQKKTVKYIAPIKIILSPAIIIVTYGHFSICFPKVKINGSLNLRIPHNSNYAQIFLTFVIKINSTYEKSALPEQTIYNNQYGSELNVNFGKNTFFSYNLDYKVYENKTRGLYQEMPILNVSVFKYVGKAQKSEIRLTVYDVFKKNLGVNQNAFQNFVSFEKTKTLSQYVMLSYTYNMRGLSSSLRKN
jgi:hypothetical protein